MNTIHDNNAHSLSTVQAKGALARSAKHIGRESSASLLFFSFFPLLAKDQEKDPPRTRFMENRLAFGFLQGLTYLISVVFDLFMRCIIIEYLLIETW